MRSSLQLLLLLSLMAITAHAQNDQFLLLNIGDPAPPLRFRNWIKGAPIQKLEKGKVYVLEFWSTWCAPCRAAMPHLSALANEYKDTVTILGVDVMERKNTSIEKVKAFVDSMGARMNYHVAAEDSNYMAAGWMEASGEQGIPSSFVVNAEGRLAWIGHPKNLPGALRKIVNNDWDINEASAKRKLNKHLRELDDSLNFDLMNYSGDYYKQDYIGKPDSPLLVIEEIVRNEPNIQYAPLIAHHTFSSLLKTNQRKAYEYGKVVLVTPTYEEPAFDAITGAVEFYADKLNLSTEIYELAAKAYQAEIDRIAYPELHNTAKPYNKMAEWYGCARNKSKAIDAQQKAIEALKSKKDFSITEMTAFKSRLQHYKAM